MKGRIGLVQALFISAQLPFTIECRAQAAFSNPEPIGPNIDQVRQPFAADIDGDGRNEVLLGSSGMGSVISIRADQGAADSYQRLLPTTVNGTVMTVADVDGDGIADILRSSEGEETGYQFRGLYLHRGDGQGGFLPGVRFAPGLLYNTAWVADLDGDGRSEVIAFRTYSLDVYAQDGPDGSFIPIQAFPIGTFGGLHLLDFNGDGIRDLLYVSSTNGSGSVKLWTPATGQEAPQSIGNMNTISSQDKLYADDLNGDDSPDLIAQDFNNGVTHTFKVWLNSGSGSFTVLTQQTLGSPMSNFQLARFAGEPYPRFVQRRSGYLLARPLFPTLQFGADDTLAAVGAFAEWSLGDADADGNEDLLQLDNDRLLLLRGPLMQGPPYEPAEVFAWPHRQYCGLTVIEALDGGDQVAFISGMTTYGNDVFIVNDTGGNQPLTRTSLAQSTWLSPPLGALRQGDLDGDGDQDLVGFLNQGWGAQVFSLENLAGTYLHRSHAEALAAPGLSDYFTGDAINLFDADEDGATDILLGGAWRMHPPNNSFIDPRTYLLRQTGPFQFPVAQSPFAGTACFNHGDMNGDGLLDRLRYSASANVTTVEFNNGDGTFSAGPIMEGCYSGFWADVDGDGRKELLSGAPGGLFARRAVDGVFEEPFPLALFSGQPNVDWADVNGDGLLDVAIGATSFNPGRTVIQVLINEGAYPIESRDTIYDGPPREFRFVDLDRDGFDDLYLQRGACIYWMKNLAERPPPPPVSLGRFTVYPNPASNAVQIDLGFAPTGPVDIDVTSITGQIARQRIQLGFKEPLDLYGLASGAYIITARNQADGALLGTERFILVRE